MKLFICLTIGLMSVFFYFCQRAPLVIITIFDKSTRYAIHNEDISDAILNDVISDAILNDVISNAMFYDVIGFQF